MFAVLDNTCVFIYTYTPRTTIDIMQNGLKCNGVRVVLNVRAEVSFRDLFFEVKNSVV